jgi:hypothetical protein
MHLTLGQAQFAIELSNSEAVQGPWVGKSSSFAVELDCLCRLATATPAILAAGTSLVGGIGVTMFRYKDKEQEGNQNLGSSCVLMPLAKQSARKYWEGMCLQSALSLREVASFMRSLCFQCL